ncbi:MAG: hypothetical protein AAGC56_12080 [Pseudomonadota bacterium]
MLGRERKEENDDKARFDFAALSDASVPPNVFAPSTGISADGGPVDTPADGATAALDGRGRRGRLSPLLDASVGHIIRNEHDVERFRKGLAEAVAVRARGQVTATAQYLRGLIAMTWMLAAAWFGVGALVAAIQDSPDFSGIPVRDALRLGFLFATVGFAGLLACTVALGGLAMTGATGSRRLREAGAALGRELAALAQRFDEDLGGYREKVVDRAAGADHLLDEVSRAHLVALEAKLLFSRVDFLTLSDRRAAEHRFASFLNASGAVRMTGVDIALGVVLGLFIGVQLGHMLFSPDAGAIFRAIAEVASPRLAAYPLILSIFASSVILFAFVGLFVRVVSAGMSNDGAVTRGRSLALDAVRSAFTAQKAPRPDDVILQVEDIVEILRARLAGAAGAARLGADDGALFAPGGARIADAPPTAEPETPAWRRKDEGPRFVDQTFSAAPRTWRTDAGVRPPEDPDAPSRRRP